MHYPLTGCVAARRVITPHATCSSRLILGHLGHRLCYSIIDQQGQDISDFSNFQWLSSTSSLATDINYRHTIPFSMEHPTMVL